MFLKVVFRGIPPLPVFIQFAPRLPQRSGSEASSGLLLGLPLGQYSLVGQRALEQPASVSAARPANGGGRTCAGVVR